jgi:hypothetical protein
MTKKLHNNLIVLTKRRSSHLPFLMTSSPSMLTNPINSFKITHLKSLSKISFTYSLLFHRKARDKKCKVQQKNKIKGELINYKSLWRVVNKNHRPITSQNNHATQHATRNNTQHTTHHTPHTTHHTPHHTTHHTTHHTHTTPHHTPHHTTPHLSPLDL